MGSPKVSLGPYSKEGWGGKRGGGVVCVWGAITQLEREDVSHTQKNGAQSKHCCISSTNPLQVVWFTNERGPTSGRRRNGIGIGIGMALHGIHGFVPRSPVAPSVYTMMESSMYTVNHPTKKKNVCSSLHCLSISFVHAQCCCSLHCFCGCGRDGLAAWFFLRKA